MTARGASAPGVITKPATERFGLAKPLPLGCELLDNQHDQYLRTVQKTEKITDDGEGTLWRTTDQPLASSGNRGQRSIRQSPTRRGCMTAGWAEGRTSPSTARRPNRPRRRTLPFCPASAPTAPSSA